MTTRLTLAIQEHYEQLSPSERRLAALLLDRAEDMLTYSATELAAMAEVSKATAARLFRSLGYADFNEVRLQAREERDLAQPFQAGVPKAPRVWLLGIGLDEGLVRFARPQLARVRPDVHCLGTQSGAWAEDLAMTGPRDALLLVLTQPRPRMLERLAAHAATTRIDTVAVVDIRNVAWARRVSKVVLPCYASSAEHAFSAMAAASMLHLLVQ